MKIQAELEMVPEACCMAQPRTQSIRGSVGLDQIVPLCTFQSMQLNLRETSDSQRNSGDEVEQTLRTLSDTKIKYDPKYVRVFIKDYLVEKVFLSL